MSTHSFTPTAEPRTVADFAQSRHASVIPNSRLNGSMSAVNLDTSGSIDIVGGLSGRRSLGLPTQVTRFKAYTVGIVVLPLSEITNMTRRQKPGRLSSGHVC
jgi:hypothetical protein